MDTDATAQDDTLLLSDPQNTSNHALLRLVLCAALALVAMGLAHQVLAAAGT
jgi:hypothetical protein